MSKKRVKAMIVGGAVLVSVLGGAGAVYAATNGPDGSTGCAATTLYKAVGPNGSSAADQKKDSGGGPVCAAPVAPVAPISH